MCEVLNPRRDQVGQTYYQGLCLQVAKQPSLLAVLAVSLVMLIRTGQQQPPLLNLVLVASANEFTE